MTLVSVTLAFFGLLAPGVHSTPRGAPALHGPCVRAARRLGWPAPPEPPRHAWQRPRACLEEEAASPRERRAEAARLPASAAGAPAGPHGRGPEARSPLRPPHVPLIYALCTLLI